MTHNRSQTRRKWTLRGGAFALLLALVFILGSLNVPGLEPADASEMILLYVLSTLVFLAFVIYSLVLIRYLVRLYAERKRGALGSQFKTRMVAGALALSLLPVMALFFLSYALVNRTLAKWFPRPLEIVRDDALYMIRHVLEDHESQARDMATKLATDQDLTEAAARQEPNRVESVLKNAVKNLDFAWAAVSGSDGQLLASFPPGGTGARLAEEFPRLLGPPEEAAYTATEEIAGGVFSIARVRLEDSAGEPLGDLVVARPLEATLLAKKAEIEAESLNYSAITRSRKVYRWQALLILLLVTTLILLASTWLALFLAKEVTVPIQALAEATEQVSHGNLAHRVVAPARDELATLVDSFNSMTAQLEESRRAREEVLAELDQRRRWMETLLESIPTGVLTLSTGLRLLRINPAAVQLLGCESEEDLPLGELMPGSALDRCKELLETAGRGGMVTAQVDFPYADRIAHVAVTAAALRRSGQSQGYVLVLDDLSDLLKAQKAAAWQEVAKRIAHEIKNPLTPIQLSADRIRNYAEGIRAPRGGGDSQPRDQILQCAATIGEEVHSLKTLVDEFSQFARFPAVRPVPMQLNEVVESTLQLYRDGEEGVRLTRILEPGLPLIDADGELVRRVVSNLLRNAAEALGDSSAGDREIIVTTRFAEEQNRVELSITDTGPGIPPENKEGLFLPFFSTKETGMGLGLAIVSRIVSEHGGRIRVEDNQPRGTRFVVEFPALPRTVPA